MVGATGLGALLLLFSGLASNDVALSLRYWAIEAAKEGQQPPVYDSGAAAIKDSLTDLAFDTFRTVQERQITLKQETPFTTGLTPNYTMTLQLLECAEADRARVSVRVKIPPKNPEDAPRTVIETTLIIAQGGKARVGGLRTDKGELVIVLARTP